MFKPPPGADMLASGPFSHLPTPATSTNPDWFELLGIRTIVIFFSHRLLRGGSRLLFQVTACIVLLFIITKSLPQHALGSRYTHLVPWTTKKPIIITSPTSNKSPAPAPGATNRDAQVVGSVVDQDSLEEAKSDQPEQSAASATCKA